MAHTVKYRSKSLAEARHQEMKKQGYKPTRIQKRGGQYVFSLTK